MKYIPAVRYNETRIMPELQKFKEAAGHYDSDRIPLLTIPYFVATKVNGMSGYILAMYHDHSRLSETVEILIEVVDRATPALRSLYDAMVKAESKADDDERIAFREYLWNYHLAINQFEKYPKPERRAYGYRIVTGY